METPEMALPLQYPTCGSNCKPRLRGVEISVEQAIVVHNAADAFGKTVYGLEIPEPNEQDSHTGVLDPDDFKNHLTARKDCDFLETSDKWDAICRNRFLANWDGYRYKYPACFVPHFNAVVGGLTKMEAWRREFGPCDIWDADPEFELGKTLVLTDHESDSKPCLNKVQDKCFLQNPGVKLISFIPQEDDPRFIDWDPEPMYCLPLGDIVFGEMKFSPYIQRLKNRDICLGTKTFIRKEIFTFPFERTKLAGRALCWYIESIPFGWAPKNDEEFLPFVVKIGDFDNIISHINILPYTADDVT